MTFTASNGMRVWRQGTSLRVQGVFPDPLVIPGLDSDALREFFQHERDEQLGRWRSSYGEVVVYLEPDEEGDYWMVHEPTGEREWFGPSGNYRRDADDNYVQKFATAEAEFIAAHPKPKPWHDAKPGEVWVLTMDGVDHAWGVGTAFNLCPEFVSAGGETNMPLTWHEITAGRRIYPEVS